MSKKITTTKSFTYDAEGRILTETVTTVEEDVPAGPVYHHYWYPQYPQYPQFVYPYTIWSSAQSLTTGSTYKTYNTFDPPKED